MTHILLAQQYIGKEEKPNNGGFKDTQMEADMIKYGAFQKWMPWCCCFARMIFMKAYPEKAAIYKTVLFPGTRQTFDTLKAKGYTISQKPVLGALVLWATYRSGIQQPTGHAGIVSEVLEDGTFKSIEGNGSANGSRNGDRVVEHHRTLDLKPNGLNILGFISI